jgi:hypothetical protein
MYVCMYVLRMYICVSTCVCIRVCMYMCMYVYVYVCICKFRFPSRFLQLMLESTGNRGSGVFRNTSVFLLDFTASHPTNSNSTSTVFFT